jgi:hypothetical protein
MKPGTGPSATLALLHFPVAATQVSVVHGFTSSQSAAVVQPPVPPPPVLLVLVAVELLAPPPVPPLGSNIEKFWVHAAGRSAANDSKESARMVERRTGYLRGAGGVGGRE